MKSKIVEINGKVFVLDQWQNHFTKPIRYRQAWPTGLIAKDYPHIIGKKATPIGSGTYRLDNGLCLRLEYGDKTLPDKEHSEEQEIPRPPKMKTYRGGKWHP